MLKCVFVVNIWPFRSGPRGYKSEKMGVKSPSQNPHYPSTPISTIILSYKICCDSK